MLTMKNRSRILTKLTLVIPCFLSYGILGAQTEIPDGTESSGTEDPFILMDEFTIAGKAFNLLEKVPASSIGVSNNSELSQRPFLRRGELLEVIPGFIATQHAGGGKANQYFVRGYNLDHGTDFHISVDGMPVNSVTHAHGQGYADINFIIPEFIERLEYSKGPFFTRYGDLSTAGAAEYEYYHVLPSGIASVTVGEYEYQRYLIGDSLTLGDGYLSAGAEYTQEDGPWDTPNNYRRGNIFVRYHRGDVDNYWNLTFSAHEGIWDSSDQIPRRALEDNSLGRFDTIDDTTGGNTSRYSLQLNWQQTTSESATYVDAWIAYYDLELYSNFTYFLADPVNGDQFEQNEGRYFGGARVGHDFFHQLGGLSSQTGIGFQTRNDLINDIGLYPTEERERVGVVREDDVYVGSYSVFLKNETVINDWLRAGAGIRGDLFYFDVDSNLADNSGSELAGIYNPKLNVTLGPWERTEFYLNAGFGFHSNDARGTSITVDPADGTTPVEQVDPLVRTKGAEFGIRSMFIPGLTITTTLWYLESDSELVFVGDGGATEPSDASRRYGLEVATYWRPRPWLALDAEYSFVEAAFRDVPNDLDEIPNSIRNSLSLGVAGGFEDGLFGSLRTRYFNKRPLNESGSVESKSSLILNGRIGYRLDTWEIALDVLNILNRKDNDIEYFYESRLPGEPLSGIEDVHLHPVEPRQVRVTLTYKFE